MMCWKRGMSVKGFCSAPLFLIIMGPAHVCCHCRVKHFCSWQESCHLSKRTSTSLVWAFHAHWASCWQSNLWTPIHLISPSSRLCLVSLREAFGHTVSLQLLLRENWGVALSQCIKLYDIQARDEENSVIKQSFLWNFLILPQLGPEQKHSRDKAIALEWSIIFLHPFEGCVELMVSDRE